MFVTGGHFAGAAGLARAQRQHPRLAAGGRLLSALDPLPKLVAELNDFAPSLLAGYPSALDLLAAEQGAAGSRLADRRWRTAVNGGTATRRGGLRLPDAAHLRASELPGMAYDCGHGWLHLHADWAVLEPVDADLQPVAPGELSATVLPTNLANHVQPLLRYDRGDRVLMSPEPCRCGSPLPALRVEGRTNDTLAVETGDGRMVHLLPLAVVTVVEETPGVRRCQLIQTGRATLRIRLEPDPGADPWPRWPPGCTRSSPGRGLPTSDWSGRPSRRAPIGAAASSARCGPRSPRAVGVPASRRGDPGTAPDRGAAPGDRRARAVAHAAAVDRDPSTAAGS